LYNEAGIASEYLVVRGDPGFRVHSIAGQQSAHLLSTPLRYPETIMYRYTIAVVVGSLRRDSYNGMLANAIATFAPPDVRCSRSTIADLPLYNQDDDASPHASVARFRREIAAAQAVLFVTPEHNRSLPAAMKNALDHGSRPYGSNVWQGKPAGILGVSPAMTGTALAQQHLRNILSALDMPVLAQPDAYIQFNDALFDASGNIGPGSVQFFQNWMARYIAWVRLHTAALRAIEIPIAENTATGAFA
jgi:chromate reductase